LIKLYNKETENYIANTLGAFYMNTFASKNATDNEIIISICFFDDLMEYGSEDLFRNAFPQLFKLYLEVKS
jgi:hypothetical protein